MIKKVSFIAVAFFMFTSSLFSQDFLGYNSTNYQTAGGMIYNPASIAGSRYKVSVNILSLNVGATTNAYEFKKSSLFGGSDMREEEDFFKNNSSGSKDLFLNLDILGPSFMLELGPKIGSVGFSSRVRFLLSENNLENDILQLFGNSNPSFFGHRYTQNDLLLDLHAFADFGLTYARTIWGNKNHVIKGGLTLKYVKGIAGGSLRINNLQVEMDSDIFNEDFIKSLEGDITLLYSDALDVAFNDNSDFNDIWNAATKSNGFGFDIGAEYEWYKDGAYQQNVTDKQAWKTNILTPYTLKVSASITDIGSVKYDLSRNAASYRINMSDVESAELDLNDGDLNDYIERLKNQNYISELSSDEDYKLSLPTRLRLNVDWNAYKRVYVNAGVSINMVGKSKYGGRHINYYHVTPRYESTWLGVYSPLSINSLSQFHWGVGVNLGAFFIGSGSILSNLFSSNLSGTDVHIGFSVPIRQKAKTIEATSDSYNKKEVNIIENL